MSGSLTDEVAAVLRRPQAGPLVLVTVGNPLRADDGAGPVLASLVRPTDGLIVHDAGSRPEEIPFLVEGQRPGRIVIVDAADFGGRPGEARVIPPDRVSDVTLSTHGLSPAAVCRLLARDGTPVVFIGIQAACLAHQEGLSAEVERTVREMAGVLAKEFGQEEPRA